MVGGAPVVGDLVVGVVVGGLVVGGVVVGVGSGVVVVADGDADGAGRCEWLPAVAGVAGTEVCVTAGADDVAGAVGARPAPSFGPPR